MSTGTPHACGHELPTHGPYGQAWACAEVGRHRRHRFRNYTWPRVPQVWNLRGLVSTWQANRKLRRMGASRHDGLMRYRAVLYPKRFDPLPVPRGTDIGR